MPDEEKPIGELDPQKPTQTLIIARLRGTLWIIIAAMALLSLRDLSETDSGVLLSRAGCATLMFGLLVISHLSWAARHATELCLMAALGVVIDTALVSHLRQDLMTPPLVLSAVAMFAAAVFRCGLRFQLAVVGMAVTAIVWNTQAMTGSFEESLHYGNVAAAIALAASVWVARELERQRREIERTALALRRSEAWFRSLIENSSDLITVIDPQGTVIYDSPAHEHLLGYSRDERIGSNALDLVHPEDVPCVRAAMAAGIGIPGQKTVLAFRYRHKSGVWRHMEAVGYNLLDDPNVGGIVVHSRDVTERRIEEDRHLRQRDALLRLTRSETLNGDNLQAALREITETAAQTLDVARVSIWRFDADHSRIECIDLFEGGTHSSGGELRAVDYPHYFEALESLDVGAADDAARDPFTREFAGDYLSRHGISSMMDAPIRVSGSLHGVLCHEHVGPPRCWTADEKTFAIALVNLISLAVEGWERKEAEHVRSLLVRILDASPELVGIAHAGSLQVRYMNPAGRKLLGLRPEEDISQLRVTDLHPPSAMQVLNRVVLPAVVEQGVWSGEGSFLSRDGREVPVLMTVLAHKSRQGEIEYFSAVSRDITERKHFEAELLKAKQAAEAASRAKSEFLANMSHEIRTPMNGVLGMTDLLLDTPMSREQREYLDMVRSSAHALLTVINDVLDFSKIEAGKLEFERVRFSLRECLEMTARVFELGARDKGLKLDTLVDPGVPDALVGDPARLRQVLNNLVGNAIKFTERGQVTVSVTRADGGESDRHGDAVLLHFCVRDTGIGIPPEKQDVIFRAFEQADQSVSRRFGGSGLGLAISARLVRLMNGRIWVESELQRGSAFHFEAWFDLAGAEQGLSSAGESPATSAPGKEGEPLLPAPSRALRLLLVEDNPVNQRLARRLLEKRGHSVRLAGNGREALAALASDRFDAILMDVQMPEMDGFEATAAIRAAERAHGGHIPIVAMTAHAMSGDEERCLAAGMDAYLSKPIEPRHLFALLDELATATANASEPRGGEAPAV